MFTKEPETIAWLNELPQSATFWDIGANVGIFSVYAAKTKLATVVAVEPSNLNLEFLFKNIQVNECQEKITIVPLAVSDSNKVDILYMSRENLKWGGAHNSAGSPITQSGTQMENPVISKQLIASIDQLVATYHLPIPDFIKIDVDGLELQVLLGALNTLQKAKSVLIEVDLLNVNNIALVENILESNGFKRRLVIEAGGLSENQIWDSEQFLMESRVHVFPNNEKS